MPRLYSFWYSKLHAEWYKKCNNEESGAFKTRKTFIKIRGKRLEYTACTSILSASEPFDGALKNFPDYQKLGHASDMKIEYTNEIY